MSETQEPQSNPSAGKPRPTQTEALNEAQAAALKALTSTGLKKEELPPQVLALLEQLGKGNAPEASATAQSTTPEPPRQGAVDWSTEGKPLYANGLHILHRPTDFAIAFTDHTAFPGRGAPGQQVGAERAVVVSSLRMTPDAFFEMLCTMASNWNRYVTTMVDARMRQPRFKLIDAGDMQLETISKPEQE